MTTPTNSSSNSNSPQPVLALEGVSFGYEKEAPLYQDFSLTLDRGQVAAVVGPSGSGKSTLFGLITGELKPWNGTVAAGRIAQVYQDPYTSFHQSYTVRNQIEDVAPWGDEARELMAIMSLDPSLVEKRPHELSGGQLQRCSILRALLMKPDLLLADEPTSALDNIIQLETMKLLMRFLDRVGIVLITHDRDLAKWCSDRIIDLES